ncbi:STAS domain-containing protein [Streptomyces sp. NBC_01381]|uniref:STAS domain-containing protein n=1 Tax=Streptomyces sp. NBC_01381 TaxID=2903845 RepID=UPI0022568950|nr:STAS domain-containing protein [Streptomyces sp. NBC_01381]MCX4671146.1 STAS domain-containing protein [Streptomyces sp. NBC_01381]
MPNPPRTSLLDTQSRGLSVVATLHGEIDLLTAPALSALLAPLTGCARPDVLVDLRQVAFIDGTGLAVLAVARDAATAHDGRLRLICTHPLTLRILHHPGLGFGFDVLESLPAAA